MTMYKFGKHPAPGYYEKTGEFVTAETKRPTKVTSLKKVTASMSSGLSPGFSGADNLINRYNPVKDRLDEGSIVEDWLPRDAAGLDQMFKLIYHRDPIAGTVVDLIAETIWSDFQVTGVSDPAILKIYQDCLSSLSIQDIMPGITREFLVLGKTVSSLIFDKSRGYFTDIINHDQDFLRITPIPVWRYDPKVDLLLSPAMQAFLSSQDYRDLQALDTLPEEYVSLLRSGGAGGGQSSFSTSRGGGTFSGSGGSASGGFGIPLDPINTMYIPRRVFGYDHLGTSMLTRVINFWALEKALINSTQSIVRRRTKPVIHAKCGIDNMWEPTAEEMDAIAQSITQTEQDPNGGVLVTRTGVDISSFDSGTDFYKWGDELELLTQGKLKALGANDALLTGDATYSNQETARAFFMERANMLRNRLTEIVFYKKIFPLIAKANGFVNRSQAELQHRIRYTKIDNKADNSNLIIPKISWNKDLVNNFNDAKIENLKKLDELGLPIMLSQVAAAADVNIDNIMQDLEKDSGIRRKIQEYKDSFDPSNLEKQSRDEFIDSLKNMTKSSLVSASVEPSELGKLSQFIFWESDATFGGLPASAIAKILKEIDANSRSAYVVASGVDLRGLIRKTVTEESKAQIAHFLFYTSGLTPVRPEIEEQAAGAMLGSLGKFALNNSKKQGYFKVVETLQALSVSIQNCTKTKSDRDAQIDRISKLNISKVRDPIPATSRALYSGLS